MKTTVTVSVSQNDIQNGTPGAALNCMVHLALRRLVKRTREFAVAPDCVTFDGDYIAPLPKQVVDKVWRWDTTNDSTIKPFSFKLKLPDDLLRKPAAQKRKVGTPRTVKKSL